MPVEWNIKQGDFHKDLSGSSFLEIMARCMKSGAIEDATESGFAISTGAESIVFKGDITLDSGAPHSGMIEKIKVYDGDQLVAKATGYILDLGVIFSQLGGNYTDVRSILLLQPIDYDGSPGKDHFVGGAFDDTLRGNDGADYFYGSDGDDFISGGKGKDRLNGAGDKDVIRGGKGKDSITGGADNDTLTGGKGKDTFHFFMDLNVMGVDTITDFKPGVDTISLGGNDFSAIGNKLNKGEFHIGGQAQDGNDHILFKAKNGALFYDPDGDGAASKVKFAVLSGDPDLSHKDFTVSVKKHEKAFSAFDLDLI